MAYNNKKSKLEQYQEKLKERETNNDTYFLDKFSNNKFGKTLNLQNNSLTNKENQTFVDYEKNKNRAIKRNFTPNIHNINNYSINNNNDNNYLNSLHQNSNNNINNNNFHYMNNILNNQQINYYNNINNNNNFYNHELNQPNKNNMNNMKKNNPNNNAYERPKSQNKIKNNNFYNNISGNDSNDPFGNNYKGTGIIPRDRGNNLNEERFNQNQRLKEIWAIEMLEKKEREEKEKKRQKELDILEEERIKREIAEQIEKEEKEKQRKKQNEENIVKDNAQLLQNKKILNENGNKDFDFSQNNSDNNQPLNSNNMIYLTNKLNSLNNKYKNIDLNNIHFYRSINNNNNSKLNDRNKAKKNKIYSNRKVNEFEFSPNPRQLEDSNNPQISQLKKEVNSGYMEISSLFKQLKNNVIEANQNRNKAENQFKFLSDEINKEKKYQLKLEKQKYDQVKQEEMNNYNYANVRDVDPIYYTKNEKNLEENNLSNLAKAGQNLIRLTAQSEFIPIGSNIYENNIMIGEGGGIDDDLGNNIAINNELGENNLEIESETIFQPNEEGD